MLIKDNTEHCTVLSSMCISVCNVLSHVSILMLLYLFFYFFAVWKLLLHKCVLWWTLRVYMSHFTLGLSSGDLKENSPHFLGHSTPGAQIVGLHPMSKNVWKTNLYYL